MRRELPMILIRGIVSFVFIVEGVLAFLRPEELGTGHLAAIGLPYSHLLASAASAAEIVGGITILLNFCAGDAALLLLVVIVTALLPAKLPILLGHPLGFFPLPTLPHYGWLSFFYAVREELLLLFSSIAILIDSGLRMGHRRPWYQSKEL